MHKSPERLCIDDVSGRLKRPFEEFKAHGDTESATDASAVCGCCSFRGACLQRALRFCQGGLRDPIEGVLLARGERIIVAGNVVGWDEYGLRRMWPLEDIGGVSMGEVDLLPDESLSMIPNTGVGATEVEIRVERDAAVQEAVDNEGATQEDTGSPTTCRDSRAAPPLIFTHVRSVRFQEPTVGSGVSDDIVKMYLDDIGKHSLLTGADEVRLAEAIKAGIEAATILETDGLSARKKRELHRLVSAGEDARWEMVQSNLRLVVSIAKRYQGQGLDLLDLVQEGTFGLIRAVDKFDHKKGFKFSTYGTWWIRQAIRRGIANSGRTVRIPEGRLEELKRVTRFINKYASENKGVYPTLALIAERCGVKEDVVIELIEAGAHISSLDAEQGDEDGYTLYDQIADPEGISGAIDQLCDSEEVERLMDRAGLDERESEIIRLRFGLESGDGASLKEVGKHFGLTRERIRQIESRILIKMRRAAGVYPVVVE